VKYKDGNTFLELNYAEPDAYLNPAAWREYFAAIEPQFEAWAKLLKGAGKAEAKDGSGHWGALPFRVKQLFDVMVKAAKKGNAKMFLVAGGVLIHYIGDACQPLHASYLSQGDPARVIKRPRSDKMKLEADGVHSGYEDEMIAYGFTDEKLAAKLMARIKQLKNEQIADIETGYDAAKAVIALIRATQAEIAPRAIVNKWVKLNGKSKADKVAEMWEAFGHHHLHGSWHTLSGQDLAVGLGAGQWRRQYRRWRHRRGRRDHETLQQPRRRPIPRPERVSRRHDGGLVGPQASHGVDREAMRRRSDARRRQPSISPRPPCARSGAATATRAWLPPWS
jgi:hypothetical protein